MRTVIGWWLSAVVLVALLYLGGPALFFNHNASLIVGMPPMVFWFLLVPVLTPLILGALYLYDRRHNPQQDQFDDEHPSLNRF